MTKQMPLTGRMPLFKELERYGESDFYPYHMPGHKRRQLGDMPELFLKADITEIDGFDNLHQPMGILREAQEAANRLYGAEETCYLINGSTCGILSAVSAALPEGGHLLLSRGCHRSAYHAAYLRKLNLHYVYPGQVDGFEFDEAVTAEQVRCALQAEPEIGAVLIVSPTYEGRIADVRAIAEVVHAKGIPLIVDEAHGAHLGFAEGFASGSCSQGADVVIHSVHKTLPAMTQTALIHMNGNRVDRDKIRRFLHIYETSSPSYVLMSSICDAMKWLAKEGVAAFAAFRRQYLEMYQQLNKCKVLRFLPEEELINGKQDIGKLVIGVDTVGNKWQKAVSGQWLYDVLREKYHLQCEMAAGRYCLAMFTVADSSEAYERMTHALLKLDEELLGEMRKGQARDMDCVVGRQALEQQIPEVRYPFCQAWDMPWKMKRIADAVGLAVGDFVNLFPPGSPILVPGEVLSREYYELILAYRRQDLNVQGLTEESGESYIRVVGC